MLLVRLHVILKLKTLENMDSLVYPLKICRVMLIFYFFHLCFHGRREENKHTEEEMESEKEEEDSEEEEMESSRAEQASGGGQAAECGAGPALTKAQARELRRVKKHDHSWLAGLLHTST